MMKNMYNYDLSKGDYVKMRNMIGRVDWSEMPSGDVDKCWNKIKGEIHDAMRDCIPKVKQINNKRASPIWMTGTIRWFVKNKYNWYKKYLSTHSENDERLYLNIINDCNRIIRRAKRKHDTNFADESKSNPIHLWKYVQSNMKNACGISTLEDEAGQLCVSDIDKANVLNTFLASVFTQENVNDVPCSVIGAKSGNITTCDIGVTPAVVYDKLYNLNKRKSQ